MKKPLPFLAAAGGLLLGLSANAQAEELGAGWSLSSNVAITSNYLLRGGSESDEDPAIQGGFDLDHASGFYIGTWGSSVVLGEDATEIDFYAGYAFEFAPGLSLDLGAVAYTYYPAGDSDDEELYAGIASSFGELDYDFYLYSNSEPDITGELNLAHPIGAGVSALGQLGFVEPDDDNGDYIYYAVGASYTYQTLDFSVMWTDTDESGSDDQFAVMVSRSF
ncbi:TorF family putative porin [Halorhodospira halophila]|uniref:Uncharacterized protein n=1 Tax=Halorhodospira halophila (strain DSM 244 / SL1) TaxID=349124 RepID=A1WZQ4_HALHL|nr:TorF family putative porin [Halorhodospira halophila]ABM63166.1 conserved hypothetical protein [Halorhodospira halophila SL1]MBK1729345.1 hypothetical protein [Halorhodospira halophila]